jgi:hypothetical protein
MGDGRAHSRRRLLIVAHTRFLPGGGGRGARMHHICVPVRWSVCPPPPRHSQLSWLGWGMGEGGSWSADILHVPGTTGNTHITGTYFLPQAMFRHRPYNPARHVTAVQSPLLTLTRPPPAHPSIHHSCPPPLGVLLVAH